MIAEYIIRAELIENLNKFAPEHLTPLIRSLIEKQPTADVVEVPKWIDVKEGLPKDNEKVLCLCQADIYEVLTWDNVQRHWVHDSNHIYFKTFVRYWQALPEAPTKNDKE